MDAFGSELEAAGLGRIVIERDDEVPGAPGPTDEAHEAPGPVDAEGEAGPTAGAEEPPPVPGDDSATIEGIVGEGKPK